MEQPLVSINLVVRNGQKYIRLCLDAIKKQDYQNLELNIWDNNSDDDTREIIKKEYSEFHLIEHPTNLATWGGHEKLLQYSHGIYIVAISVDIIMQQDFVTRSVYILENDIEIGALQPKIYQYSITTGGDWTPKKTLDTCGFKIFRSRRVINVGHGEEDKGQYDGDGEPQEIFAVEGAVPVLRRSALEDIRINHKFTDEDFWWYTDDVDFAWRMRLFGWRQVYAPSVVAYHDRQTTKSLRKSRLEFIKIRRQIPFFKRALDYRNTILMLIKNDHLSNIIRDLPYILKRHIPLWGYFLIFEPKMIFQLITVVRLLPRMVQKRRAIMRRARIGSADMRRWFSNG